MKVGIDFDRVLFKTDKFNEFLKKKTGLYHVDADVYDKHGCYSPMKHAEAADVDINKIYEVMADLEKFLYNDVKGLADVDEHEFVIVTRGEERFQMAKIEGSGADKLFEKIFTVQDGSKDIHDIEFLVDDRKKEIEQADIPGMVFKRGRHTMKDVLTRLGELQ